MTGNHFHWIVFGNTTAISRPVPVVVLPYLAPSYFGRRPFLELHLRFHFIKWGGDNRCSGYSVYFPPFSSKRDVDSIKKHSFGGHFFLERFQSSFCLGSFFSFSFGAVIWNSRFLRLAAVKCWNILRAVTLILWQSLNYQKRTNKKQNASRKKKHIVIDIFGAFFSLVSMSVNGNDLMTFHR